MQDFMVIGSSPAAEDCVQVSGAVDYLPAMKKECLRFKAMLEEKFPNPPPNTRFAIKRFEHDFGPYLEVCVIFDDENEASSDFAYKVEGNTPEYWGDFPA